MITLTFSRDHDFGWYISSFSTSVLLVKCLTAGKVGSSMITGASKVFHG